MNKRQGIVVFVTFALYLVIGGSVFMTLENNNDEVPTYPYLPELQNFMGLIMLQNNTQNVTYMSSEMWNDHVMAIYENYTISLAKNQTTLYWTFYDAFFMCLTVVTTIGYGNISPRTGMGRVFCILYGFIGIPIAGIFLAAIGDFFSNVLLEAHEKYKTTRSTPLALLISTVTYLIPGLLLFLFLPAGIFMILEEWTYLEGFYYAFITLTTIGFGDYVAGTEVGETQWIYKLALMAWIIFGLGYLSMILNFIAKAMKSKQVKQIEKTVAKNLKQTHEVLTKEMEYFMKTMNDFYMKKVKSKPNNLGTLKRTSSCPSMDRPIKDKLRKSSSTRSLSEDPEFSGHAETSANFILDLAMALACGELEDPGQREMAPEVMSSRKNSIAQLITMALVPPTLRSNSNLDVNFSRSSTRKSLSPFREFLYRNGSVGGKKPKKEEKSNSLFEGLLIPAGLGLGKPMSGDSAKDRRTQKCNSDHNLNAKDVKNGPVITRSVSNPASFNFVDRFADSGLHTRGNPKSEDSKKCKWIIGAPSSEDMSTHTKDEVIRNVSKNPTGPSGAGQGEVGGHRRMSECEIPSVIMEEEKSDCESDLSVSGSNLASCTSSSDQGISSQETIAIDIECENDRNSRAGDNGPSCNPHTDSDNGKVKGCSCLVDMDCEQNKDFSTRM